MDRNLTAVSYLYDLISREYSQIDKAGEVTLNENMSLQWVI